MENKNIQKKDEMQGNKKRLKESYPVIRRGRSDEVDAADRLFLHVLKPSKYLIWTILAFAIIGFLDASYLTISHLTGAAVNCSITGGCDTVLGSQYAEILGIPLPFLGLAYYATIFFLALFYLDGNNKKALKLLTILPALGFAFSLYLVYLQFFVIEAICQYCMLSAINSTILATIGLFLMKFWRKK